MIHDLSIELLPAVDDHDGCAANESSSGLEYAVADAELLVATTVARVTEQLQPAHVDIELDLSAHGTIVAGNPTTLAFALAGILGGLIRAADETGDDATLRVVVTEHDDEVAIAIASSELPPLRMIRALGDESAPGLADPTARHCRHIVERQGGSLGLSVRNGELAIEFQLPAIPQGRGIRVLRPASARTSNPSHAARAVAS
jgi:hypothetical protein